MTALSVKPAVVGTDNMCAIRLASCRYCGSCYIHGALHAANDRLKLMLNGMHDVQLARQGQLVKAASNVPACRVPDS